MYLLYKVYITEARQGIVSPFTSLHIHTAMQTFNRVRGILDDEKSVQRGSYVADDVIKNGY